MSDCAPFPVSIVIGLYPIVGRPLEITCDLTPMAYTCNHTSMAYTCDHTLMAYTCDAIPMATATLPTYGPYYQPTVETSKTIRQS